MLKIQHFLENMLTDGCEVVSFTCQQQSALQKHFSSASGTHFCYILSKLQDLVWLEGLGKLNKFNDPIRSCLNQLCYHGPPT
jgi:hypothetical protein